MKMMMIPKRPISKEHQSFIIPSPTIEFAALCLRNAIALIDFYAVKCSQLLGKENDVEKIN